MLISLSALPLLLTVRGIKSFGMLLCVRLLSLADAP